MPTPAANQLYHADDMQVAVSPAFVQQHPPITGFNNYRNYRPNIEAATGTGKTAIFAHARTLPYVVMHTINILIAKRVAELKELRLNEA
jgi:hypothetical protein